MSSVDEMGDIEHTINRLVAEAEETLTGLYGEPTFEDEHTDTLQAVVGPMADQFRGAVEALEWIERFTSDRGDARMMEAGQARTHIHRRASAALGGQS